MHLAAPELKTCVLLPPIFYDDSPTGLMLDCSIKSMTMARQLYHCRAHCRAYFYYISTPYGNTLCEKTFCGTIDLKS